MNSLCTRLAQVWSTLQWKGTACAISYIICYLKAYSKKGLLPMLIDTQELKSLLNFSNTIVSIILLRKYTVVFLFIYIYIHKALPNLFLPGKHLLESLHLTAHLTYSTSRMSFELLLFLYTYHQCLKWALIFSPAIKATVFYFLYASYILGSFSPI